MVYFVEIIAYLDSGIVNIVLSTNILSKTGIQAEEAP